MRYKLQAYNIWEQGKRENQEDSVFPAYGEIKDTDRLFILCDGMGGHSAGEVASSTVCYAMSQSVFKHCPDAEGSFTEEDFGVALNDAFDALDEKDDGAVKKMGTTMTFLKFHDQGCTIAHMGDSRVYHIRPGKDVDDTEILYRTTDHSLVNDLVRIGELTPEEARHSNHKNVITRAMQPSMERRPKADVFVTDDIMPGDYFFMCSDGILEQMEDDESLKFIFSERGGDDSRKVRMLIKATGDNSDNHSAIIIHVINVLDREVNKVEDSMDISDIDENQSDPRAPFFRRLRYLIIGVIVVLVIFVLYSVFVKDSSKEDNKAKGKHDAHVQIENASGRPDGPADVPDAQVDRTPLQSDPIEPASAEGDTVLNSIPDFTDAEEDIPESDNELLGV